MQRRCWALVTPALFAIVMLLAAHGVAQAGCSDADSIVTERIDGRVIGLASSVRSEPDRPAGRPALSLLLQTTDGPLTVTLTEATTVTSADGLAIEPATIRPGTRLAVEGERTGPDQFVATAITILS